MNNNNTQLPENLLADRLANMSTLSWHKDMGKCSNQSLSIYSKFRKLGPNFNGFGQKNSSYVFTKQNYSSQSFLWGICSRKLRLANLSTQSLKFIQIFKRHIILHLKNTIIRTNITIEWALLSIGAVH